MRPAYEDLTRSQLKKMTQVVKAEKDLRAARIRFETEREQFGSVVLNSLNQGVPARAIAEKLGMSSARIYQIRDEAMKITY